MVKISKNITNKIAGRAASKKRKETRVEIIAEVDQKPIKIKKTTGRPNLPTKGTTSWRVFNEKLLVEYTRLVTLGKKPGSRRDYQDRRTQIFSIDKQRVIKPLVSDQMGIIRQRFPQIKEADLVQYVYKVLRKELRLLTKGKKGIRWIDDDEFEVTGKRINYKVIQRIITELNYKLRKLGFESINKTKRKLSSQQQLRAGAVLAITGTDVRSANRGGDIRKFDTEISDDGIVILRADETLDSDRLKKIAQDRDAGLEIGHTFGAGIGNITAFAGLEEEPSFFMSFFSPEAQARLIEIREAALKIDANTKIDFAISTKIGKKMGTVSITIAESRQSNASSGGQLRPFVTEVRQIVLEEFGSIISEFKASKPVIDQVVQNLLYQFTTLNPPKRGSKKSYKASKTAKVPIQVHGVDLKSGKRIKGTRQASSTPSSNLSAMIALINRKLHDQIRDNMGKGNSKQILNYRTGRFAKSARVQALYDIKEKGALGAKVKYMRYPYAVFEPEGRLYKPGRDPHRIFGRSIRQILQEERIANLRRVKVDLSG